MSNIRRYSVFLYFFMILLAGCTSKTNYISEIDVEESHITAQPSDIIEKEITEKPLYSIVTEHYIDNKINLKYPKICDLGDDAKEHSINELIKNDLVKTQVEDVIESYKNDYIEDVLILELTYEIKMQSADVLSVLYTGMGQIENSNYISCVVYGITIDLNNVKILKLTDFTDIDIELVKNIRESSNITNEFIELEEDKQEYFKIIRDIKDEEIIDGLKDCWGPYTFCITPDSLIVSIGIYHAGGDYILVEIPYQYDNDFPDSEKW